MYNSGIMKETARIYFLYVTTFITGAIILAIEVLGTRIVGPFFGTTVFVWTSLIIVTLGALAVGYFVGGYISDKYPHGQILYSVILVSSIFVLAITKIYQWVLVHFDALGMQNGPLCTAIVLFSVPLFLLGLVSPYVIRLTSHAVAMSGATAGKVFALGTLGSIVGGYLAGFYLIDKASLSSIVISLAVVLMCVALIGLFLYNSSRLQYGITVILLIIFSVVLKIPAYVYEDTYTLETVHHEQSTYADLKIVEIAGLRCMVMNGATQSCVTIETGETVFGSTLEMANIITHSTHENPTVLLLGLGAGDLSELLPETVELDIVEIDPRVVVLAKEYFPNSVLENHQLIVDDARHFLRTTEKTYDIIISDLALGNSLPSHVYSAEALGLMKQKLSPNGLALLHITAIHNDKDRLSQSIIETAQHVFPAVIATSPDFSDTERAQSVFVHASTDTAYVYNPEYESLFPDIVEIVSTGEVVTDDFNALDVYATDQLVDFRKSMLNFGGYRLLFSI